ncbi:60S ribosomal protein L18a-like protein [Neltuma alba]|uniref:60S ribosomal protein L18a-like protein n=1 Tax=Neltuma alba TaxID=207710 RepID=UPI0010A39802|nr:60S ribosomal protein L18a-like protein [Prosopis alba]
MKMNRDDNVKAVSGDPQHPYPPPPQQQPYPPPQYGTFQGVSNYPPPPQPAIGFPQPVPPPGVSNPSAPQYYPHGYQASPPGYAVVEGMPVRERRLPCCGIGFGWFLFIIGFFLGALPWYVGVMILVCSSRLDHREKPGYIACTIAAVLATIAIIIGATRGPHDWD